MAQKLQLENFLPYRLNRAAAAASAQLSSIYRQKYGLTVPNGGHCPLLPSSAS